MQTGLRAILYVSQLAEPSGVSVVGSILSTARLNNALHGETGVLVFDGERFCQYVEGETAAVRNLLGNLLRDKRHDNVQILADLPIQKRLYERFRMGYCDVEDLDALRTLTNTVADQAVGRFNQLVTAWDVEE